MEVVKMKKTIIITIIVGMFSWAIFNFVSKSRESTKEKQYEISEATSITTNNDGMSDLDSIGLQVGHMAPDFELTTLDGETIKLSEFRGQRVMLNFWAAWCPPCRTEMPDMQKFYENKALALHKY